MGSTVGVVGVGRLELVSQSPLGGGEHHNTTKVPWRRRGREGEECGSWAYNWCCSKGGWGIYSDRHSEEDGGFTTGVGVGGFHNTGRMLSGTRFIVKGCH